MSERDGERAGDGRPGQEGAGDARAGREPDAAGLANGDAGGDGDAAARVVRLEREVARLREQYATVQRTRYRRLALGFAVVGLLALAGAVVLAPVRTVLVALGGTGLFGAVMTYYLTPERFVPAEVSERITADLASNQAALVAELGLQDDRVYVPRPDRPVARLFVPREPDYVVPDAGELDRVLVVPEDEAGRGVAFTPAGNALFVEFEQIRDAPLAAEVDRLVDQLCEGLTDGFELVDRADVTVDATTDQVTVRFTGSVYGGPDRFDHPALSFVAVGLARGLDSTVVAAPKADDDRDVLRATYTVVEGLAETGTDADEDARREANEDTNDDANERTASRSATPSGRSDP